MILGEPAFRWLDRDIYVASGGVCRDVHELGSWFEMLQLEAASTTRSAQHRDIDFASAGDCGDVHELGSWFEMLRLEAA